MSAVLKEPAAPMTAAELVKHCRATRTGIPAGDIADPKVLHKVLTLLLEKHIARIQDPPRWQFGAKPVDPREDATALAIATLVGYLEDRPQK